MGETVVSCIGPRFVQIPGESQVRRIDGIVETWVKILVKARLIRTNPHNLIIGGHLGFDMIVGEVARDMKLPYQIALPYPTYHKKWQGEDLRRIEDLKVHASSVKSVSRGGSSKAKFERRDRWIIDRSTCVMALWDGMPGRTEEVIKIAYSRRTPVENIWREFVSIASANLL